MVITVCYHTSLTIYLSFRWKSSLAQFPLISRRIIFISIKGFMSFLMEADLESVKATEESMKAVVHFLENALKQTRKKIPAPQSEAQADIESEAEAPALPHRKSTPASCVNPHHSSKALTSPQRKSGGGNWPVARKSLFSLTQNKLHSRYKY